MIIKPAVSSYSITVRDDAGQTQVIATSSREIISILCTAGGSSAAIRIYDANDTAKLDEKKSILIAANAGESTPFTPTRPAVFKNGIIVVFEQGFNTNSELFLLVD